MQQRAFGPRASTNGIGRPAKALAGLLRARARRRRAPAASIGSRSRTSSPKATAPDPPGRGLPDDTDKAAIFRLLDAERAAGTRPPRELRHDPAPASASGIYLAHPEARYLGVGRIGQGGERRHAARRGMPAAEVERWLDYEPAGSA